MRHVCNLNVCYQFAEWHVSHVASNCGGCLDCNSVWTVIYMYSLILSEVYKLILIHNLLLLFRGAVLEICHANLVGSGGGVGRVSTALNFFVELTQLRRVFWPFQANGWVPFLVVVLSLGLLCFVAIFTHSTL